MKVNDLVRVLGTLWHIMKTYAHHGYIRDFVLCPGKSQIRYHGLDTEQGLTGDGVVNRFYGETHNRRLHERRLLRSQP